MYYPKERSHALSNTERRWLDIACRLAETSDENNKHGAVIVLGGAVQSMGINKNTIDPRFHKDAPKLSVHAEEAALKRCKRTQGAILFVARVNKHGEQRMSRPCAKCMHLLRAAGVKKIIYTINQAEYL